MRWLICLGVILSGCGVVKAPGTLPLKWIVTIHTAEAEYHFDNNRFATSLQELGPSGANMMDRDLASGEKGGYRFTLTGTSAGYAISAVSEQYGGTGNRTYFSDQSTRIHVHSGPEPATVNDPLLGQAEIQQESDPVAPRERRLQPRLAAPQNCCKELSETGKPGHCGSGRLG
jgi:hypothetical protein